MDRSVVRRSKSVVRDTAPHEAVAVQPVQLAEHARADSAERVAAGYLLAGEAPQLLARTGTSHDRFVLVGTGTVPVRQVIEMAGAEPYSTNLPSPEVLAEYDRVKPGFADAALAFAQAEQQQARHVATTKRMSLFVSGGIGALGLSMGAYLLLHNLGLYALAFSGGAVLLASILSLGYHVARRSEPPGPPIQLPQLPKPNPRPQLRSVDALGDDSKPPPEPPSSKPR
jgi:hypothetical protein